MRTLKTTTALYAWTRDMEPHVDSSVEEVLHLVQERLTDVDWAMCILHELGGDSQLMASKTKKGKIRLESSAAFKNEFGIKVDVKLPRKAVLQSILDGLNFVWK